MTDQYIFYPEKLSGDELDTLLARGWYRMGQSIFTTHYLVRDTEISRVFWLRYDLDKITPGKTCKKIKNAGKELEMTIAPMEITPELEELYTLYKTGIDFMPAESIEQWLYAGQEYNVYNTELITLRDRGVLIGAGIYDLGHNSIAGIMNFFHPEYKKYSPGKLLMLLKTERALSLGMRWYYPGYIVYQYPKFDYKLFMGRQAAELYIPELNKWSPYHPALMQRIEERE